MVGKLMLLCLLPLIINCKEDDAENGFVSSFVAVLVSEIGDKVNF